MLKNLLLLLVLGLFWTSCTEVVKPTEDEIGRAYFPLELGDFWIYDVTETRYANQFLTRPGDSVQYQVRERVDTVYRDQTGQLIYSLIRSRRQSATQPWVSDSIVLVQKATNDIRITRNNTKKVALVFPVTAGKRWNGNAFNTIGSEEYQYDQVNNPFTVRDTTFQKTVRVEQFYSSNLLELDDRQEIYAAGVGLIYKRTIDIDFCNDPVAQNGCEIGKGYIVRGIKRIQRIRSFRAGGKKTP